MMSGNLSTEAVYPVALQLTGILPWNDTDDAHFAMSEKKQREYLVSETNVLIII